MELTLGISTCPNDTYIFGALIEGFVRTEHTFDLFMDDVQVLNNMALKAERDILKVSYGVVPMVLDNYRVLKSGGALGFGCGPLVVSASDIPVEELKGRKIAIPGVNTSAFRFFKMFFGEDYDFVELRFDMIMPAIASGDVAAGVIIHEGRFVYQNMRLKKLCDLGELYEKKFNSPIPLGAIIIKKDKVHLAPEINRLIKESIIFADTNYDKIEPFIKKHAQEMEDSVIRSHIGLYVNEFSKNLDPAVEGLCKFLDTEISVFV